MLALGVEPAVNGLVERRVRIPQFDADAPLPLLGVSVCPDSGKSLSKGGLAVVDVTDHAYVDFGLTGETLYQFSSPLPIHSSSPEGSSTGTASSTRPKMASRERLPTSVIFRLICRVSWLTTLPRRLRRLRIPSYLYR